MTPAAHVNNMAVDLEVNNSLFTPMLALHSNKCDSRVFALFAAVCVFVQEVNRSLCALLLFSLSHLLCDETVMSCLFCPT